MPITFEQHCIDYLKTLRALHGSALTTAELSLRTALENFLKRTAETFARPVQFIGEGKRIQVGRPDFIVTINELPIGYIEAEAYGVSLDHLTGHAKEQNDRFRANLDNFLLTNHLVFRLYLGGELVDSAKLPIPPDSGAVKVSASDAGALAILLERFMSGQLPSITDPRDLATHLARRTRQMGNEVRAAIASQIRPESGDLIGQYHAFRDVLLPDLTEAQFADMYAQTVAYGLFAARCAAPTGMNFSRQSAADLVPKTNPFLRKLFQQVAAHDLDDRVAWMADDIAQLLAHAPMADILTDFGARTKQEDPVVHFYETFLAAYDSHLREVRGVYYTPEPVVSYIVRSIDHLLRTHFHKPMGLADEHTLILDPATGTGSFLFAVVNQIRQTVTQTVGAGGWSGYVPKHLLPRLYGFELLIAPYAVAHLKLGLLLQESGYDFHGHQRVGIYLTNTLDAAAKRSELLWGRFISDEANEASAIKQERPILVVLGNPPYSGHSANRSRTAEGKLTFIGRLIEDYKQVDGKPLGERTPKWLQDDYVKFIRFAQWRIEQTGEGIIGYITNHGYLDNPTFRGMRQHLMQTFNAIYVYNLHGNSKKKERTPDGGKDENVFDIQQGVAILLCLKEKDNASPARVYHADLWGLREGKYQTLAETDVSETQWTELQPQSPFYLFVPQDTDLLAEYKKGWKVTDIFPLNGVGMTTARDHVVIDYEDELLLQRAMLFRDSTESDAEVCQRLGIPQKRGWNISNARRLIRGETDLRQYIKPVLYRPFDERLIFYHDSLVWRTVKKVMRHMLAGKNVALVVGRSGAVTGDEEWNILGVSGYIVDFNFYRRGGGQLHPLYLYPAKLTAQGTLTADTERRPNLSPAFLKALSEKLSLQQTQPHGLPEGISPEDIFHYAYAVFHSPTYRERYTEFLKIDFARLPLTSDLELFCSLASLGKELVSLHLLDTEAAPVLKTPISPFPLAGSNEVERVRYDEAHQRVYINKTQCFEGVPPEVWEFCVGGYQVCEKWLKDRCGRQLSYDDLTHYQKIVVALRETLRLMAEIDAAIESWPIL